MDATTTSRVPPSLICAICGFTGPFIDEPGKAPRDNLRCGSCRSSVRQRDVAQLLLDEFGSGRFLSLAALMDGGGLDDVSLYEVGIVGPVHRYLQRAPKYVNSYFWDDVPLGASKGGVRCEDLRALTFDDASFDLIVSVEVLEHVFDVQLAFREIGRVLRPGGVHVFSIPVRYPLPSTSTQRARLEDGTIVHLVPPHYHVAGDGSKSLVITDFGADLADLHRAAGLRLSAIRRSAPMVPSFHNLTFIARKL